MSIALDDPSLYLNRELSWLQFNRRVLEEAQDAKVPLLERCKFLAIFASNLDEFFMVRVAGLLQKVTDNVTRPSVGDRLRPLEQLHKIRDVVAELVEAQYRCWGQEVKPALQAIGIHILNPKDFNAEHQKYLLSYFRSQVFPILTPLAVDPGHPFPHLANKTLNIGVMLRRPGSTDPDPLFAVVQVPALRSRLIELPTEPGKKEVYLTPLETVIRLHLQDLFHGMEILNTVCFRVTRDSEFELEEEEVDDLLRAIEENVKQRRRGHPVRLEIEEDGAEELESFLVSSLDITPDDVTHVNGKLDLTLLYQVHAIAGFIEHRDPPFSPILVKEFSTTTQSMWSAIRAKDILVHHPYESFKHVVDFIETAADDDKVQAIKQTLYRTSSDSPIVKALQRAVDRGKQVTAVIELKARLDEERNILWAKELEKAGVHVVYGFIGLKTHCKVALVVRKEENNHLRRYVHLGTGNYNPQTARTYTDVGLFTANPAIADDATLLFNYLTGYAVNPQWQKLIVAPTRLQPFMLEKIEQEIVHQKAGKPGRIVAKINGLLEPMIVQALYRASQAGVKIDIVCRGICAMRPGVPGVSENIRVISVVDRFLEHSRIYYFGNGGQPDVYVGSADWMDRNLSRRVEVVFPIEQPDLKTRVIDEIMTLSLQDNVKARELLPDGSYRRLSPGEGQLAVRSQTRFLELAAESIRTPSAPITETAPPPKLARRSKRKPTSHS
ncbi:MAG: polyphosphate kinase 1 [Fimbriiglobus sp.]